MSDRGSAHPFIPTLKEQLASGRLDRREFLRTATLLGMSASAAYLAAGLTEPSAAQAQSPAAAVLRIGMRVGDVKSPHALSSVEASNIVRQVCDYLTRTGHDNITRPVLLDRWEASGDLKTWTLHLRRDVTWRKGRPFRASDVVWNIKRVLDAKTGSSVLGLMKSSILVEKDDGVDATGKPKKATELWAPNAIEAVDDFTVRLNLRTAQLAIPEHLFHYPFFMLDPEENGEFKVGSNGTGAYELAELEVGKRAVLKGRDKHWKKPASFATVEFLDLGSDPAAWIAAMAAKQVDGLYEVDIAQLDAVKALPHVAIYSVNTAQTGVARMKYNVKPFDDKRVRQAFRLATDNRAVLNVVFRGLGAVGENHHVAPVHPEYAKLPEIATDPAKAKALLAEAGHANGIDVEITCRNSPVWELNAVQTMVEQWAKAGIRCKINPVPTSLFWEGWTKVPFGFTSWAHRPLGLMTLGLAYRTGVPWNESSYANPAFDKLLDEAEGTLDVEKRRAVMAKLEQLLQDDGTIVQPLWRQVQTGYDKKVKGFAMHPTQYIFLEELSPA